MQEKLKSLILIGAMLFMFSCKKERIAPTDITIKTPNVLTYVGGKDTIDVTLTPAKASANTTWSSSNPAIASVNQSGVVTGIAAGSAVITATAGNNVTASCTVTVTKWTVYNTQNSGLAGNNVYAIAIDAQGNKWFGTDKGVSKFDGINWTTYNTTNSGLADNAVHAIVIDNQGNKWFVVGTPSYDPSTSNAMVSEFDGTNWITYDKTQTHLASNSITSMAVDTRGNKWFGTFQGGGGVLKFDGNRWANYPQIDQNPNPYITAVSADSKGNVWFGLWITRTIWEFDGTNWTIYSAPKDNLGGASVAAMAPDIQGNMWVGTAIDGAAISEFNGGSWTTYWYNYTPASIVPDLGLGVKAIAFDLQNNKWFGTVDRGAITYDGVYWTTYSTKNSSLANNSINAIAIDAQGNKWFGHDNGGGVSELYGL